MTELLTPAKTDYLLPESEAPVQHHREVTDWLSEMEFFKTELDFFSHLLDNAWLRVVRAQTTVELESLEKKMMGFTGKELPALHEALVMHEKLLAAKDLETIEKSNDQLAKDHAQLGKAMGDFTSLLKELKKELFDLVEKQLRQAKQIVLDYESGRLTL